MNIKAGDIVEYTDVESYLDGKIPRKRKIGKRGVWDGKKVVLNDKAKTTVYNLNWLRKIIIYDADEIFNIIYPCTAAKFFNVNRHSEHYKKAIEIADLLASMIQKDGR